MGPQGPAGNDGATGPQGPQGPAGNNGAQPPNVVFFSGTTSLDDYDVTGVTAILFDGSGNIFNSTVGAVEGQIIQIKVLMGDLTITDYSFTGTQVFWYNSDGAGGLGDYQLGTGEGCTIMYTEAYSGVGRWYIID